MALLPVKELKIEDKIENERITLNPERGYLGISGIGAKCLRQLWYGFRLCSIETITPRQYRLLNRGHREEPIIVEDLEKAGVKVWGDQKEVVAGWGHMKGHIDGLGKGILDAPKTTHLLEFKTANQKNFNHMKKYNLMASKPIYYDQMNTYSHLLELKRGLFIMVNKNDDARYYERIKTDKSRAIEMIQKGELIIQTETPTDFQKIGGANYFECKWCKHYAICQYGELPIRTCRMCIHSDICDEGVWECSKKDIQLSFKKQLKACKKYKLIGGF